MRDAQQSESRNAFFMPLESSGLPTEGMPELVVVSECSKTVVRKRCLRYNGVRWSFLG